MYDTESVKKIWDTYTELIVFSIGGHLLEGEENISAEAFSSLYRDGLIIV